jgi:hypothetical protein
MDSSVEDDGVYGPSPLHATAMNAVNQDQDDDDDDDDTRDQATIPVSSQIRLSEHIRVSRIRDLQPLIHMTPRI